MLGCDLGYDQIDFQFIARKNVKMMNVIIHCVKMNHY